MITISFLLRIILIRELVSINLNAIRIKIVKRVTNQLKLKYFT